MDAMSKNTHRRMQCKARQAAPYLLAAQMQNPELLAVELGEIVVLLVLLFHVLLDVSRGAAVGDALPDGIALRGTRGVPG